MRGLLRGPWYKKKGMSFRSVGPLKLLPPGTAIQVDIDGNAVAVCNVDGTLHAIDASSRMLESPPDGT